MPRRARLYCGYEDNVNESTTLVNEWGRFPYPSTGLTVIRSEGPHPIVIDPDMTRFTWTGDNGCYFRVEAVCNVYKGSGGNANRNIEFCWYKNSQKYGFVRGSHMNAQDSQIISGSGWMWLDPNDYIEPYIRNIENDDKILLKNCTFLIEESSGY